MSTKATSDALQIVRKRFEFNIKRVHGLVVIYNAGSKDAKDILRAAVVLLHATLEDALRGMLAWKLPDAPMESVKGIQFNGLFPDTRDRIDKISLAQLRQHRNKTVEEVCREAIVTHLSRESYNNKEDVVKALMQLGIPIKNFAAKIEAIEPAMLRRHQIVHQSDRKPAKEDHGKPRSIGPEEVEKWTNLVNDLVEMALAFFGYGRANEKSAWIKPLTRKQFNKFGPARSSLIEVLTSEEAWYADSAENILGTVLFDKTDKDWGWVMLGRDPKGEFRAIETAASITTREEAAADLIAKMVHVSGSGQKVFEQD
jgi:hypothetical protein